jgi:nucleotide sugar dehydrogenase
MNDFKKLPRLVSAIDEKISSVVSQIYIHVFGVELISLPNCKTANAVKLTTNVFRDVNIAFVNELSMLFDKLGIDTYTVMNAAKHKYNFQAHFPGPGVGGPCLPVNSYQYLNSSKKIDPDLLKLIQYARKINEKMPDYVIRLTSDAFKESNKSIKNSDILILGVSYKPNVKDIQLSPAEQIIRKFQNLGVNIHIYDPYFSSTEVFGIKVEENLDNILSKMDAVVIVTDHNEFKKIEISSFNKMENPILIDTRGIFDPISVKHNNIIFRGLGRGNF